MPAPPGSICYLELFARNLQQSVEFYAKTFGWKTTPSDSTYVMWEDPNGFAGGLITAGSPHTNHAATVYLKVDDVPGMLRKIVKNGGTVVREKTEIGGGHGFYALFRDPADNNIGIWCER